MKTQIRLILASFALLVVLSIAACNNKQNPVPEVTEGGVNTITKLSMIAGVGLERLEGLYSGSPAYSYALKDGSKKDSSNTLLLLCSLRYEAKDTGLFVASIVSADGSYISLHVKCADSDPFPLVENYPLSVVVSERGKNIQSYLVDDGANALFDHDIPTQYRKNIELMYDSLVAPGIPMVTF